MGYAGVTKGVSNLIGAAATIDTKRALLECEGAGGNWDDAVLAFQGAAKSSGPIWAQSGYVRWRLENSVEVHENRYIEVVAVPLNAPNYNPATDFFQQLAAYPDPTMDLHAYACLLEPTTGEWLFGYDLQPEGFQHDAWINTFCDLGAWKGEVRHTPTQMPGIPEDKVHFTECRLRITGNRN